MVDVRVRAPVAPADVTAVRALDDAAAAVDGHPSLGDSVWRDLEHAAPGTAVFLAEEDGDVIGALHLARADSVATAAVVAHPEHRESHVATALVDAAVEHVAQAGGGHLALWAFGADSRADAFAESAGFEHERELWQMRVPLPLGESAHWPPNVETRSFEVGGDEDEWLRVNNRAFAQDPDQGEWSIDDLRARMAEPWFDPEGLLLAHDADGSAGFCWTKLHPAVPPHEPDVLGEIYVIGTDPDRQGSGLGRALVVAGLAWLHEHGAAVGMLFVDAANAPAVALYRKLGFDLARIDRAYGRDVS